MSYKIDIDALDTLYGLICQQANDWNTQISCVHTELSTIVNTTNMTGAAADNLKDYFSSVHFSIIASLVSLIDMHLKNCLLYKDDYQTNIDTDLHATIHSEDLEHFKSRVNAINELAVEFDGNLASALSEVSDIFSISYDDVTAVSDAHNTVINQITTLDGDIIALEDTHVKNDFVNTEELIESLTTFISEQMANPRSYKSDFSKEGFFISSASFSDLALSVQNVTNEAENKEIDVLSACENHKDRVELLQEEYEERAKEAQVINWVVAGACVVGSIAVIVVTGGTATPLVMAGVSAVTAATMAGTSNLTAQYVEHGNIIENADEINWGSFAGDVVIHGIVGFATGYAGAAMTQGITNMASTSKIGSQLLMKEGMSKVVTSSVIAGGSETVSGIAMRGAGTFVTSGFDVEAAAGDAFDFKYIATDFVIGAGSAGIKEYTSLVSAQKAADVEISSYNRNNDVMLKAENSGLTNLVESKNGGIDFSQSDYIFKTDTGDVMEIKIEATGSISKDYQAAEKIAMEKYGIDLSQMRKGTDSTYKWHWLDDYNVMNNEVTMQFVNKEALNKLENIDIPKGNATKQYYVIHGNISSYGRGTSNNVYEGWKYSNAAKDMATSIRDNSISALNNNDKITSSEYMQLAY